MSKPFDIDHFIAEYFRDDLEVPINELLQQIPPAKLGDIINRMAMLGYSIPEIRAFEKNLMSVQPTKEGSVRLTKVESSVNRKIGGITEPEIFFGFNKIGTGVGIKDALDAFGLNPKSRR